MTGLTLSFGYEDTRGGEPHKAVTIGRRVTGADLLRMGDEPDSDKRTMFSLLTLQAAITSFGTLPMPTPITALLSLNRVDRDDLSRAYDIFLRETAGGRRAEKLADDRCRLAFGFKIGGETYDVVRFGKLLNGYDEMKADELEGWRRGCYILGQQVTHLSQSEGSATKAGPLDVEAFADVDATDIFKLQEFSEQWLDSFRRRGGEVREDGGGRSDVPGQTFRMDGGADTEANA